MYQKEMAAAENSEEWKSIQEPLTVPGPQFGSGICGWPEILAAATSSVPKSVPKYAVSLTETDTSDLDGLSESELSITCTPGQQSTSPGVQVATESRSPGAQESSPGVPTESRSRGVQESRHVANHSPKMGNPEQRHTGPERKHREGKLRTSQPDVRSQHADSRDQETRRSQRPQESQCRSTEKRRPTRERGQREGRSRTPRPDARRGHADSRVQETRKSRRPQESQGKPTEKRGPTRERKQKEGTSRTSRPDVRSRHADSQVQETRRSRRPQESQRRPTEERRPTRERRQKEGTSRTSRPDVRSRHADRSPGGKDLEPLPRRRRGGEQSHEERRSRSRPDSQEEVRIRNIILRSRTRSQERRMPLSRSPHIPELQRTAPQQSTVQESRSSLSEMLPRQLTAQDSHEADEPRQAAVQESRSSPVDPLPQFKPRFKEIRSANEFFQRSEVSICFRELFWRLDWQLGPESHFHMNDLVKKAMRSQLTGRKLDGWLKFAMVNRFKEEKIRVPAEYLDPG
jgi:hypothetical protein